MIPAGWTITRREGDEVTVASPFKGPGFRVLHAGLGGPAERLLYALADALLAQSQTPAPAPQADPLRAELEALALQMDRWAAESEAGGWSTHQVEPMRREAHRIRVLLARHAPPRPAPTRGCHSCEFGGEGASVPWAPCASCVATDGPRGSNWRPIRASGPAR